ncbi:MAG: thioredoxin family protein [Sulfurimonas sp.]|nr:thioredoxin family protein [Sulfurimonas sp.]
MKKLLSVIFLATSLFSASLEWSSDYEKALVDAKAENKLVYIFITSDNCKWCKKFANTTLQDEAIKKRLADEFIRVHISRDQHTIPKQFESAPVPRHYFTDAEGNILYSSLGHRGTSCFDAFMDNAQDRLKVSQ